MMGLNTSIVYPVFFRSFLQTTTSILNFTDIGCLEQDSRLKWTFLRDTTVSSISLYQDLHDNLRMKMNKPHGQDAKLIE
jgi:hypothetical protein